MNDIYLRVELLPLPRELELVPLLRELSVPRVLVLVPDERVLVPDERVLVPELRVVLVVPDVRTRVVVVPAGAAWRSDEACCVLVREGWVVVVVEREG